ncbi:Serine/threonine-protein phosphatase 2A regulatory subunit B'' subunit beta [Nowakowskiella sp. JEL0078]|nr:Serine/threonine-protein phosphatase 2A regulatory subunit B'' subunit beta [Nowakowskiella sp. JEL0078]
MLTSEDIEQYDERSISSAVINRIMEGYGQAEVSGRQKHTFEEKELAPSHKIRSTHKIEFKHFIPIIMAMEDKTTDASLSFWFRVLDLDSDGLLSLHELSYFWTFQSDRLHQLLLSAQANWFKSSKPTSPPIGPTHTPISPLLGPTNTTNSTARNIDQYLSTADFFSVVSDLLTPHRDPEHPPILALKDLRGDRIATGIFLDLLFDLKKHADRQRRTTDARFRRRDEVWMHVEATCVDVLDDVEVLDDLDGQKIVRVKLSGWAKYCERSYRKLAGHAFAVASTSPYMSPQRSPRTAGGRSPKVRGLAPMSPKRAARIVDEIQRSPLSPEQRARMAARLFLESN